MHLINVPELFDVAKHVICALVQSSGGDGQLSQRDKAVMELLVPRCLQLADVYKKVAAAQDEGHNHMTARGMCFIFSNLAESNLFQLLQLGEDEIKLVTLLHGLLC